MVLILNYMFLQMVGIIILMEIPEKGRYQVQLIAKGSIVSILQRRLSVPISRTVFIGDSKQDSSMFDFSGLKIAFNTRHEELIEKCDIFIEERDLV